MSKIFITILVFLVQINGIMSKEIIIKMLSEKTNTKLGSEFNFTTNDDINAFYSSSSIEKNRFRTVIYKSKYIDGDWQAGKYFNIDAFYNVGNISCDSTRCYFSGCDSLNNCKIFYYNINDKNVYYDLGELINLPNTSSTQPHITTHKNQKALYFVSNRPGGKGGLDIWVSMMGRKGNFGSPLNLGVKINTFADDVTPYYNKWTDELYFSSNKDEKVFNVYKSSGKINKWKESVKEESLSSSEDDLYVYFVKNNKGYFSSNRGDTSCCMNNYSFTLTLPKQIKIDNAIKLDFLPLNLYFHNDEPDPRTTKKVTKKTYEQTYITYFQKEDVYIEQSENDNSIIKFFQDSIKGNYNRLNSVLDQMYSSLVSGNKIELHIKGYASPLHNADYNKNLSSRRISSLVNYVNQYKSSIFKQYINNKKLKFVIIPYGESKSSSKTSADPNNKKLSVYSLEAMLERKIQIIDVIVDD